LAILRSYTVNFPNYWGNVVEPPPIDNKKKLLRWTLNVLKIHGIKPRKKLSQNFLVDPRIIEDILRNVSRYASTIEIGAGLGTLSYFLCQEIKGLKLFFEIDHRLASIASNLINGDGILVVGDALEHEWRAQQIVSNTPYHITSDILIKLVKSNSVVRAVLMLQRDVVERLTAQPGTREYGKLTIIVNAVFDVSAGPTYPPEAFYPPPEVSSQLVILSRKRLFNSEVEALERIILRLFSKRRKRVGKVIREEFGLSESVLRGGGVNPDLRVYELELGDLLRLVTLLKSYELI